MLATFPNLSLTILPARFEILVPNGTERHSSCAVDLEFCQVRATLQRQSLPKRFEPLRRELGVPHRVLDVLVPKVVLQYAGVLTIVGELVSARLAQHVWMDRKWQLRALPCFGRASCEILRGYRRQSLREKKYRDYRAGREAIMVCPALLKSF